MNYGKNVTSMLPGGSINKEAAIAITVAVSIAKLITTAKSIYDLFKSDERNEEELDYLRQILTEIRYIHDAVLRIETFLRQLPFLIDQTVEEKFINFVTNKLRAHTLMFIEIGIALKRSQEISKPVLAQLEMIYHDLRVENRIIMSYGAPAATVLSLTALIEDECGRLIGIGDEFRIEGLFTFYNFFEETLSGTRTNQEVLSINQYLEQLTEFNNEFNSYIQWLNDSFVGKKRSWASEWKVSRDTIVGRGSNAEGCVYEACRIYNSVVTKEGEIFIYSENSYEKERVKYCVYPKAQISGDVKSVINLDNTHPPDFTYAFDRKLQGTREDVNYANKSIEKHKELLDVLRYTKDLKKLYSDAFEQINQKLNSLNAS
ncbi:MAG: hypothetical protein KQH59_03585 [Desulfobulbaceae bacterium]|nr:hypothetical protein [Desulfobulbaceae bacterium]